MNAINRLAKVVFGPYLLLSIIIVLAACGPAGGVTDSSESDGDAASEGRSILNADEPADQDVLPTATPQSEEAETAADADETEEETSADAEKVSVSDASEQLDSSGLQVGFTEDGHPYKGDPDAPIVIKEYSDYQCPFCSRFVAQTLPELLDNQIAAGEALLIFYDFPLTNIHPQATSAANAARCAGEQGAVAYWDMHDLLFANPDEWSNQDAATAFVDYVKELELDVDAFEECVAEDRYAAEIEADLDSGAALGISGTPTFVINGQLLVGAQPLENFNSAIATVKEGGQLAGDEPSQPVQPAAAPTPAAFNESYAGAMGDPDAAVTIVEFTDYQCPFCSRHSIETMPRIVSEFVETGRVYYVLKDLPLDQLHSDARAAAEAVRCAGDQDGYWDMHDAVFANQTEWAGQGEAAKELFVSYAADIGLDESDMTACLESGQHQEDVELNAAEARALGVTGTPMFFVNGYPLNGARPFEHFELAVQYAEEGRLAEAYAPAPQEPQEPAGPPEPVEVEIGDAFAIGDPDAPITIVEFTDFQCPFCVRHFQETYPRIVDEYVDAGIVRYVFKDFPLYSIHPQAAEAAQAARCAREQDAFLEMHDLLFERQPQWGSGQSTEVFVGLAEELALDASAFEQCLTSGKYEEAVDADYGQGVQLGVTGTPAFFINGYGVSGAQPYQLFEQAIESLLAEPGG
ncbi:MAG: DsbA family protein [Chloroflexota bacterium]|nr:MAG: DsbA family protein [Chloroflexota bacterium]